MIDKLLDYDKIFIADRIRYGNQINKQYGEFFKEEPALWRVLSALVGSPFLFRRLEMKKYCKRGHLWNKENSYIYHDGNKNHKKYRECKLCREMATKEWREKNKEKAILYRKKYRCEHKEEIRLYEKNLYHHYDRRKQRMYRDIKGRVGKGTYVNRKLLFSKDEFFKFISDNEKKFKKIYDEWVKSGYKRRMVPSIDRINNDGHYSLSNIQLTTMEENMRKGNR